MSKSYSKYGYYGTSIPHDPKAYSMIEQFKTTSVKISLYDLISTSKTHQEIQYVMFKKEIIPTNVCVAIFSKKLQSIEECDAITFYKSDKFSKEILIECLSLYITPMIDG